MRRIFGKVIFFGLLVLSSMGVVHAQILYSTLPADPDGGPCFGGGNLAAVEMATPTGAPYQINGATVRMHHADDAAASFTVAVYTNNAGVPGTLVGTVGTAAGNGLGTMDLYNLTPASPIALSASTNYWVVASSTSADTCAFGWTFNASTPSGIFTYVAETQFYGGSWSDQTGDYFALQLDGALVAAGGSIAPVPTLSELGLALLLLMVATVAARRLRR